MTTYVAYSDVLWRQESVRRMEEIDSELVLAHRRSQVDGRHGDRTLLFRRLPLAS